MSKKDAIVLVGTCYQQKIKQMQKQIDGLKGDKESLLQIVSNKMLLPAIGSTNPYLSYVDLAKLFKVEPEALRKRLDRYRAKNAFNTDLFIESQNRGKNKPTFLYNLKMVTPIIEKLKTSAERPSEKK